MGGRGGDLGGAGIGDGLMSLPLKISYAAFVPKNVPPFCTRIFRFVCVYVCVWVWVCVCVGGGM